MGLFDVMEDIAAKNVTKTETGDNRIFGVVVGTVVSNYAQEMPGRVCVSLPARDAEANELKWARVAMPYSGSIWGHYFLPEVGDEVLVVFEQGNIEKPYIIGAIPKDKDKFLKQSADENNQYKRIVTRHGSQIKFTDSGEQGGENGEKDKIEIITPEGAHSITLDNDKKAITITDKEGKNRIEMLTEKGQMTIKAEKKLSIEIGDDLKFVLNGSSGTAELKAKKFKVSEADGIEMVASKSFKATAATATMEGSSAAKISGGPVTISGAPIKIG